MKTRTIVALMTLALSTGVSPELFGQNKKKVKDQRLWPVSGRSLEDYEGTSGGVEETRVFVSPVTRAAQDSGPKYPPRRTALARELAKNPDVRQIQKQYEILARGFEAQDVAAIAGVRAGDFYVDGPDGRRQGAAQMLEVLRHFFVLNKPPIRVWFTLRSVERKGPDEIAVDVFQQASRYQVLANQLRKVEHDVSQRETWRRESGVWKLRSVDSIRDQHRWVDGKQIDPSKPYNPSAPAYEPPQK